MGGAKLKVNAFLSSRLVTCGGRKMFPSTLLQCGLYFLQWVTSGQIHACTISSSVFKKYTELLSACND